MNSWVARKLTLILIARVIIFSKLSLEQEQEDRDMWMTKYNDLKQKYNEDTNSKAIKQILLDENDDKIKNLQAEIKLLKKKDYDVGKNDRLVKKLQDQNFKNLGVIQTLNSKNKSLIDEFSCLSKKYNDIKSSCDTLSQQNLEKVENLEKDLELNRCFLYSVIRNCTHCYQFSANPSNTSTMAGAIKSSPPKIEKRKREKSVSWANDLEHDDLSDILDDKKYYSLYDNIFMNPENELHDDKCSSSGIFSPSSSQCIRS